MGGPAREGLHASHCVAQDSLPIGSGIAPETPCRLVPDPNLVRASKVRLMLVCDSPSSQRLCESRLGESWFAADGRQSDIDNLLHRVRRQNANE